MAEAEYLPYVCPMCSLNARILYQCDVCCDEGCPMCIPGGDRTTCLDCTSLADSATPPVVSGPIQPVPPEPTDAELDQQFQEWKDSNSKVEEPPDGNELEHQVPDDTEDEPAGEPENEWNL